MQAPSRIGDVDVLFEGELPEQLESELKSSSSRNSLHASHSWKSLTTFAVDKLSRESSKARISIWIAIGLVLVGWIRHNLALSYNN